MTKERKFEIELYDILYILNSTDNVETLDYCAELVGYVTDAEILAFANVFLSSEMQILGYGDKARESAINKLTYWRHRYCSTAKQLKG
jgi:hypothetical protein